VSTKPGQLHYLEILISEEIAHRAQTRITRSVRSAHFPFLRTIEEFDFTFQTSLRLKMLGSYLGPELVSEGRNVVLSGPTGTGKSHLAIAIAYRAIQNGFEARFVQADVLIGELSHAARLGTIEKALEPYVHPHVLVIDELGYLSHVEDTPPRRGPETAAFRRLQRHNRDTEWARATPGEFRSPCAGSEGAQAGLIALHKS
jgi:DNA replication protein DnaC